MLAKECKNMATVRSPRRDVVIGGAVPFLAGADGVADLKMIVHQDNRHCETINGKRRTRKGTDCSVRGAVSAFCKAFSVDKVETEG